MFGFMSAQNFDSSVVCRDFHVVFEVIFFFDLTLISNRDLLREDTDFNTGGSLKI